MNSSALIIMAKEPKIGSTKTRLCPPMKFGEAANFYEALLWDTINMTTGIKGIDLAIAISPPESADYFRKISPPKTHLIPLTCADIGECLMRVLDKLLEMGYLQVMALNADGPSLPPSYIQEAKESLDQHDLVLGPTEDGGYYLIGFKENYPDLFTGIDSSYTYNLNGKAILLKDLLKILIGQKEVLTSGWIINYPEGFSSVSNYNLPKRIILENNGVKLEVINKKYFE